jgi:hypothetical protein
VIAKLSRIAAMTRHRCERDIEHFTRGDVVKDVVLAVVVAVVSSRCIARPASPSSDAACSSGAPWVWTLTKTHSGRPDT